jgi:hypothetical protein
MKAFSIKTPFGIATISVLLFLAAPLARGSETEGHGADDSDHGYHAHVVGLFAGVTKDAHDEIDATVGVEYEFRLIEMLGLGAVYETTPEAHHGDGVSVYLASVYLHPYAGLRLGLGIGEEKVHGSHGSTEDLLRVSLAYDFHVAGFGVAPTINIDRVDDENIEVYGIAFSKGF